MLPTIATGNVGSALAGEYEVANSLRFDKDTNDYLNRTQSTSPTSADIGTISIWFKRSDLGTTHRLIHAYSDSTNFCQILIASDGKMTIKQKVSDVNVINLITNQVFRDPSAWYHIVVAVDTTQATSSNRVKLYVNGSQVTSFSTETYDSQNNDFSLFNKANLQIGWDNTNSKFSGYMTEVVVIDGQALDPTSFGEFDEDTNIWKPKAVSGLTFGTNGFYLDFEDSSALGNDVSGNNNDFTVNNLTSIDQTTDTCTNNFAIINPLHFGSDAGTVTMSQGNTIFSNSGNDTWRSSTIAVSKGKWYAEFKVTGTATASGVGINNGIQPAYIGSNSYDYIYGFNGIVYNNDSNAGGSFTAPSTNDIIGVALDLDNNKIYWSLNGTFLNSGDPTSGSTGTGAISISTSNPSGFYHFAVGDAGTGTVTFECNFGNAPFSISSGNSDGNGYGNFEYSVPANYYSLCSKNLAEYG